MTHTSTILWSLLFSLAAVEAFDVAGHKISSQVGTNHPAYILRRGHRDISTNTGLQEKQFSEEELQHLVAFEDDNGNTILHHLLNNHYDWLFHYRDRAEYIVKSVIEKKPDLLMTRNNQGLTAFDTTVSYPHAHYQRFMAKLLHRHGANPNMRITVQDADNNRIYYSAPLAAYLIMNGKTSAIRSLIDITTENKNAIQLDDFNAPIVPFHFAANAKEIASLQQEGWQSASQEDVALYDLPTHDTCALMVKPSMDRTSLEYTIDRFGHVSQEHPTLFFLDHVYAKSTDQDEKRMLLQKILTRARTVQNDFLLRSMYFQPYWRDLLLTTKQDDMSIMESEIRTHIETSLRHSSQQESHENNRRGNYARYLLRQLTYYPLPDLKMSITEHITQIANELTKQSGIQIDTESTIEAVTENTPQVREAKRALRLKKMEEDAKDDAEKALVRKQKNEERAAKIALERVEHKRHEAEQLALRIKEQADHIAKIDLHIKKNMEWAAQFPEEHAAKLAELRKKREARRALELKERAAQRAAQFGPYSKSKQ